MATTYLYTIFDADPNDNAGTAWDTHTSVEIEAESLDDALGQAYDAMRAEAKNL